MRIADPVKARMGLVILPANTDEDQTAIRKVEKPSIPKSVKVNSLVFRQDSRVSRNAASMVSVAMPKRTVPNANPPFLTGAANSMNLFPFSSEDRDSPSRAEDAQMLNSS